MSTLKFSLSLLSLFGTITGAAPSSGSASRVEKDLSVRADGPFYIPPEILRNPGFRSSNNSYYPWEIQNVSTDWDVLDSWPNGHVAFISFTTYGGGVLPTPSRPTISQSVQLSPTSAYTLQVWTKITAEGSNEPCGIEVTVGSKRVLTKTLKYPSPSLWEKSIVTFTPVDEGSLYSVKFTLVAAVPGYCEFDIEDASLTLA